MELVLLEGEEKSFNTLKKKKKGKQWHTRMEKTHN